MSQIFIPGQQPIYLGPFNQAFFLKEFKEGQVPECELIESGSIPVVELQLFNGETCDIYSFEQFRREFIVAQIFVDPPKCEEFYKSYIRYETIFKINIRQYKEQTRPIGFRPAKPVVEGSDSSG
ncbi:MAG: hypothetical protein HY606_02215 [Planctomycetes bacterium]|nr:hypothetical protein [Planctomycetota bacterium]